MSKISIAEVKRRLAVGTEYIGEFIGVNRRLAAKDNVLTRRRVVKQTHEMASQFLDGPKVGQTIFLNWKYVTAAERDGAIFLTMTDTNEEFLKITIG